MGCEVQVHEKTDKRGTWKYHSVNIWYLATSPEYYHTHLCHIKTTNIDRFTNTTQFNHRNITKPTITHADKIMSAIADYDKAIRNMGNNKGAYEMQQLLQLTEKGSEKQQSHYQTREASSTRQFRTTGWHRQFNSEREYNTIVRIH